MNFNSIVENIFQLSKEAFDIIRNAQDKGIIYKTPLIRSETISNLAKTNVWLKLEALQKTGSFKVRGAYFTLSKVVGKGIDKVVTASTGNHAQGVAYAAKLHNIKSYVVMPMYTPWLKIFRTRRYGANIILYGNSYEEAEEYAYKLSKELNAYYIHAYNDPLVIAGQGTISFEIFENLRNVSKIIVPIGGGGLISGIAIVAKKINPTVKIIGVQAKGAPSAYVSFKEGKIITLEKVETIADGIATKKLSDLTFNIIKNLVDDIVLVDDNEIVNAILVIAESTKVISEGAGATSVAALISNKINVKENENVVAIVSGGNIDMTMLFKVIMKGLVMNNRLVRIRGLLPDKPGMLGKVANIFGELGVNIVEVFHERYNPLIMPNYAEVSFLIEIPPEENALNKLIEKLKEKGFDFKVEIP